MLIKKEDARKKVNSEDCIVWEYDFPSKDLGIATAKINGRYPEKGKSMNTDCDMIYFVLEGTGVIHTEDGDFELKEEDAYFINKNKWYWIEGNNIKLILQSAPNWTFEQYKQMD